MFARNRNLHADVGVKLALIYAKLGQITSCAFLSQQGSPKSRHSSVWAENRCCLYVRTQRTPEAIHDTTLLTAQRPIFTFDGRPPPVALAVAADRIHGAEI